MTLSWNTFLVKFQFTLLLSFQSNWTFSRRKLCRIVIYHVNAWIIQCSCMKLFTFKKTLNTLSREISIIRKKTPKFSFLSNFENQPKGTPPKYVTVYFHVPSAKVSTYGHRSLILSAWTYFFFKGQTLKLGAYRVGVSVRLSVHPSSLPCTVELKVTVT